MLNFFTDPYEGELLYSTIARFHHYSGAVSKKETLIQIFGDKNALPSINVPCRFEYMTGQLKNNSYSAEYFINKHTVLPYYLPFMDQQRKNQVINAIKGDGGKSLFTMIGMAAGGICRKYGLYYCLRCVTEDIQRYGEPYFHTIHQLEGIFTCPSHEMFLREYPVTKSVASRIEFVRLEVDKVTDNSLNTAIEAIYGSDKYVLSKMCDIAKAAEYIITGDFSKYDSYRVYGNIITWLANKGYITAKGHVRQRYLYQDLKNYYREDFLSIIECRIEAKTDYSWLCNITRRPSKTIHPLRYILLAIFLCGSAGALFVPPLPLDRQIKPSKAIDYDDKWEKRLVTVIKAGHSLRETARQMGCDPKTVVRHANNLGLGGFLNSKMKIYIPKEKITVDCSGAVEVILRYIKENPKCTRKEIREKRSSQYMKLYKNRRELLLSVLPKKVRHSGATKKIDWQARDIKFLEEVKMAYSRLLAVSEPVRISATRLLKAIGYSSTRLNLDKLPKTKQYVELMAESVENFQLRRVDYICEKLHYEKGVFEKWRVMRLAGLKANVSAEVLNKIDSNIARLCNITPNLRKG
ncbi:MAG: hypothetical protein H6Q67_1729 [Firmicutes bacterium]|nr:hypothetical protein [Bacillota bacterium]